MQQSLELITSDLSQRLCGLQCESALLGSRNALHPDPDESRLARGYS